jgi:hypothetical protein
MHPHTAAASPASAARPFRAAAVACRQPGASWPSWRPAAAPPRPSVAAAASCCCLCCALHGRCRGLLLLLALLRATRRLPPATAAGRRPHQQQCLAHPHPAISGHTQATAAARSVHVGRSLQGGTADETISLHWRPRAPPSPPARNTGNTPFHPPPPPREPLKPNPRTHKQTRPAAAGQQSRVEVIIASDVAR